MLELPPKFSNFSQNIFSYIAPAYFERRSRVAQNFKHEKFIWDQKDSSSLGSKHYKNAKILKFGHCLDIAKCDQNFTT